MEKNSGSDQEMEMNHFGGIQKFKKTFALPGQVPTVDTGIITFCKNPRCIKGDEHNFNKDHGDGLMCSKCGCTGLTKVRSPYPGNKQEFIYPAVNPNGKKGGNRRKIRKKKTKRKQKKSRKFKKRRTRSRK